MQSDGVPGGESQTGGVPEGEKANSESSESEKSDVEAPAVETISGEELYEKGKEAAGNKDYETAYGCFLCAAAEDSARGEYNLGIMYLEGTGVEQSDEKAKEYLAAAADKGDDNAVKALEALEE